MAPSCCACATAAFLACWTLKLTPELIVWASWTCRHNFFYPHNLLVMKTWARRLMSKKFLTVVTEVAPTLLFFSTGAATLTPLYNYRSPVRGLGPFIIQLFVKTGCRFRKRRCLVCCRFMKGHKNCIEHDATSSLLPTACFLLPTATRLSWTAACMPQT